MKNRQRTFSAAYKARILAEVDGCTERGEIGALLRREGLCSSHLSNWRRQREAGQLQLLTDKKRGHKPALDPPAAEIARLEKDTHIKKEFYGFAQNAPLEDCNFKRFPGPERVA